MAMGGMMGSWGGGKRKGAGAGGGGGGGWGQPSMGGGGDRKRAAMADVLDRPDFGPKPQAVFGGGQPPVGHDPTARKMAMRLDPNSPNNLVNSGRSIFQSGGSAPTMMAQQPMISQPQASPPMDGDMAAALRQTQMAQRREMAVPSTGPKQARRVNTMGMGLRGPSVPTGAVSAAMGSYMGRR